ncbi:MAG TPA: cytochrome P450 [Steroidobacteraceae bacterium]|jgi:cytochrome P450|nr:cytochrome P450 [Steroidobacteraceae bacterium]
MTAAAPANSAPPEAELQFDVGSTDDSLERMIELFARHGDTYRVFVPARRSYTYVIHHPDDVKRVLVSNHKNYTKGVGLDRVRILLGKGIMTSEGELWKRQRYMMQPLFHRRVISAFANVIAQENDRFISRWELLAGRGELVSLTDEMSELTLAIVLRSIFGRDLDRLRQQLGGNPFEVVTREQSRDLQFAFKFRSLTKLVAQLLARRRAEPEEHFDYVAMLMEARDKESGEPMGERELIDEVMTLIVAGHETTASGLNWTWYLLSQHPQSEARLHAEIDAAPQLPAPGLAQMEALPYTQQVINEALRLYPPGWLLSRRTIEADVLGGYAVAPGTNVLLPLYLLHRHPRFWKDPESFEPARFAPEHEAERPRFAYMPFAAGPRHCIGETFALYEMLVHLYKVARRYRLVYVPDKPLELEAQINLRTRHPLHMRLERR